MDAIIQPAGPLQGRLTVPPDKAICHRAVLIAAVAEGETEIHPWPEADDCQWTLRLVQALGVSARRAAEAVWIRGQGQGGLRPAEGELACGESGTTLRLAAGLLAGQPFTTRLVAGPSLSRRPMRRIVEPLSQMGARLEGAGSGESAGELYPPLTVHGRRPLAPIRYDVPVASAQVKSAILLAGLAAEGRTAVVERQRTRDHTERMLRCFGIRVQGDGPAITVEGGRPVSPGSLVLPGDFSSAAFFLVAASCVPGSRLTLQDVGLNPTRIGLLEILKRMGAGVTWAVQAHTVAWEPRGTVTVEARLLHGTTVEPHEVPGVIDELPGLMVAAACASGTTRFQGVGELRVKETDRVQSMITGLQALGVRVRFLPPDTVQVDGGMLRGGEADSAGDHRTAMSLVVAALAAQQPSIVRGVECVSKSFPTFLDQLRQSVGSPTVKTVDKA